VLFYKIQAAILRHTVKNSLVNKYVFNWEFRLLADMMVVGCSFQTCGVHVSWWLHGGSVRYTVDQICVLSSKVLPLLNVTDDELAASVGCLGDWPPRLQMTHIIED